MARLVLLGSSVRCFLPLAFVTSTLIGCVADGEEGTILENDGGKADSVGTTIQLSATDPQSLLELECTNLAFSCTVSLSVEVMDLKKYQGAILYASNNNPEELRGSGAGLPIAALTIDRGQQLPVSVRVAGANPLVLHGLDNHQFKVPAQSWARIYVEHTEFLAPSAAQVPQRRLRIRASW